MSRSFTGSSPFGVQLKPNRTTRATTNDSQKVRLKPITNNSTRSESAGVGGLSSHSTSGSDFEI